MVRLLCTEPTVARFGITGSGSDIPLIRDSHNACDRSFLQINGSPLLVARTCFRRGSSTVMAEINPKPEAWRQKLSVECRISTETESGYLLRRESSPTTPSTPASIGNFGTISGSTSTTMGIAAIRTRFLSCGIQPSGSTETGHFPAQVERFLPFWFITKAAERLAEIFTELGGIRSAMLDRRKRPLPLTASPAHLTRSTTSARMLTLSSSLGTQRRRLNCKMGEMGKLGHVPVPPAVFDDQL